MPGKNADCFLDIYSPGVSGTVPKMEGFLNLIAGHFGDGFSLT